MEFSLKEWRAKMAEKLGTPISRKKAAELLKFQNESSIKHIEYGNAKLREQTIFLAKILLRISTKELKLLIKDEKINIFIESKIKEFAKKKQKQISA